MSSGTLLGQDTERLYRSRQPQNKTKKVLRNIVVFMTMLFAGATMVFGSTSKAAIWDAPEHIAGTIANICNPNSVPLVEDQGALMTAALGALGSADKELPEDGGENASGNIWSTYNPMITPDGDAYVKGAGVPDEIPDELDASNITGSWVAFIRSKDDNDSFTYKDPWVPANKRPTKDVGQDGINKFKGDGAKGMYPADPDSDDAAAQNAPTVALQAAYKDAPAWVIHPSYTRYGFETFNWTVYGSSCYSSERYLNVIPQFLFTGLVEIPTLITFGVLRLSLGTELSGIFYSLVYPLTSLFSGIITPWVAAIAIFIGMPFVWAKSRGRIQKVLSSAAWISAIMFAITQLTNEDNARAFTEFSQGVVVKVSGTLACTVANQAMNNTNEDGNISLGGDALDDQKIPEYDSEGNVTGYTTRADREADLKEKAASSDSKTSGGITWDELSGVSNETTTQCGSYLDGVYNSIWQGIPLQIWAEGQVGGGQASRDRVSEKEGRIGWYQSFLNAMYANPNDKVGQASIQAASRWDDGSYIDKGNSKMYMWNGDGHTDGNVNDTTFEDPVTPLDKTKDATVWKTVPFLLNVKFLCKDDATGTNKQDAIRDGAKTPGTNKWLLQGSCISTGSTDIIAGLTGVNFVDRIGLAVAGGFLANIVFLFTLVVAAYLLYQKFVWGFMLMFSPFILGAAAFPDAPRMQFAKKYLEFCISNVVKQIAAVMLLVVSVTGMTQIVFPAAGGFFIPWMLKPYVAIAFFLAAALFALPLKKIVTGAVKGDASVVKGLSETPKKVAIGAGVAAAAGTAIVATGGAGAGAVMGGASKFAGGAAMRSGGLKGAMASLASDQLGKGSGKMKSAMANKAKEAGVKPSSGGLLSDLKTGRAIKKSKSTAGMAQKAALAANNNAKKNKMPLPYAMDENGALTPGARAKAKKDFVAANKGKFWKSGEFAGLAGSPEDKANRMEAVRESLRPQFTDENGNVNEKGLTSAANREVAAMDKNALKRHRAIGQNLLDQDAQLEPSERSYLDDKGNMSIAGQRKLVADIRALDDNSTNLANTAAAHSMLNADPEYYQQFVTPDQPNGNFVQAMNDAQRANYGTSGSVGADTLMGAPSEGMSNFMIPNSQAYIPASAPVLDTANATANIENIQSATQSIPAGHANIESAISDYSTLASSGSASPADLASAHQAVLTTVHETSGLSENSAVVHEQVISPVMDKGYSLTPDAVREVSTSMPANSSLSQTLDNYADAVETHGSESDNARHALQDVTRAAEYDDRTYYNNVASALPRPDYVDYGSLTPAPEAPRNDAPPAPEPPRDAPAPEAPAPAEPSAPAPASTPAPEPTPLPDADYSAPAAPAPSEPAPAPESPRRDSAPVAGSQNTGAFVAGAADRARQAREDAADKKRDRAREAEDDLSRAEEEVIDPNTHQTLDRGQTDDARSDISAEKRALAAKIAEAKKKLSTLNVSLNYLVNNYESDVAQAREAGENTEKFADAIRQETEQKNRLVEAIRAAENELRNM